MNQEECEDYKKYYDTLNFNDEIIDKILKDNNQNKRITINYMQQLNIKFSNIFESVTPKKLNKLLSKTGGNNNNYKTLNDNIFNYTEDSDEYDILYDSDISEESTISIRSDYSEDLITPLLSSQA
jgi:hypothetical protein